MPAVQQPNKARAARTADSVTLQSREGLGGVSGRERNETARTTPANCAAAILLGGAAANSYYEEKTR
jgi:hypothetical protein